MVLSCLFLSFLESLPSLTLDVKLLWLSWLCVSVHQASPSVLQQPFFPLSAAIASSLPSHYTSPSVCQILLFSTTFSRFLFGNPVLVNAALGNLMRQEKGVCSSACCTRVSKSSTVFTAQFTQSNAAFSGCALCFPKVILHEDNIE